MLTAISGWLRGLINASDPTRDVKLLAFGSAILSSIGWLSIDICRNGVTSNWIAVYAIFMTSAGLSAIKSNTGADLEAPKGTPDKKQKGDNG